MLIPVSLRCKMAGFIKAAEFGKLEQLLGNIFERYLGSMTARIFDPFDHQGQPRTVSTGNTPQVYRDMFRCR